MRKVSRSLGLYVAGLLGAMVGLLPVISHARESVVAFPASYPAGMIIIKQHERKLYLSNGDGTAVQYPVAIGKSGKAWSGETYVQGKFMAPDWKAPEEVRRVHPEFTDVVPGGSPHNPMGAAAITLNLSQVAIHGTTETMRRSIGTAASFGCIRMYNEDVLDLYERVSVGAPVVSMP
jgi:lipoprotein-anchoring transpeptidase ErfK/SrfK